MSYESNLKKATEMAHQIVPEYIPGSSSGAGRGTYVDEPPGASDLSMWLKSRSGFTLTDEYGNDATILPPTFVKDPAGSAKIIGDSTRASEKIFDGGSYTYYFQFKLVADLPGTGAQDLVSFGGGSVAGRRGMEFRSVNGNLWIYVADGITQYSQSIAPGANAVFRNNGVFDFIVTITPLLATCNISQNGVAIGVPFSQDITAFVFNNNNNFEGWTFNSQYPAVGNIKKFSAVKTLAQCQTDSYATNIQIHLENVFSGADISGNQQDFSHSNVTVDDLYYEDINDWTLQYGYDAFESSLDADFSRTIGRRVDGTVNTPSRAGGTNWVASRIIHDGPAGNICNLMDCKIRFTNAFFDRSNTTIWKAAAQTGYYDASNTKDFHISELNQKNLYDWLNTGYRGRLYVKFSDNSVEPRDRKLLESVFLYTTDRTGSDMTDTLNYTGDAFAIAQDGNSKATFDSDGYAKMGTLKSATGMLCIREDDGFEDLYTTWRAFLQPYNIPVFANIHAAEVGTGNYATWDQLKEMYYTPTRYTIVSTNNYDNDYNTVSMYDIMEQDMIDSKVGQEAQGLPCYAITPNRHSAANPSTPYYAKKVGFAMSIASSTYGKGGVHGPNPREVDFFRICSISIDLNVPVGNPYNLNQTPNTVQVQNLKDEVDTCIADKLWMILYFHTYNERVKDGLLEVVEYANTQGLPIFDLMSAYQNCKYL